MDDKDSEQRGRAIVQSLAVVVQSMLQHPDPVPSAFTQRTKFEAFRAPNISIRDYLMRINKYASCSPECFVLALVYIDRLHSTQGLVLTELNVHRVLITSVVLAAKFFDDHYFNNAYYSKVGGVPCSEMNELEVEFLLMTNFTLHVTTDVYVRYYNELTNTYIFNNLGGPSVHQFRPFCVMDPKQQGQLIYVAESEADGLALPMCEEEDQEYEEPPQPQNEQHQYYQQQYEHHFEQQQQQQQQQHFEQQRQHFEQQQQAARAPANGYQHGSHTNSFAHNPHSVSSQQTVEEHHNQAPPRPGYVYQQPQHQSQQTNPYGASSKHSALPRHDVHDQYHHAAPGPMQVYQHQHVGPYGTAKYAAPTHAHAQFPQHHDSNYHHVVSRPSHSQRSPIEDSYHRSSSASTGKYVAGLPPAPTAALSSASSNGIVYANSGRTSGQKRRKSIALGVNA